jgi:PPOX class probable F420-dependent enzyme
MGVALPDAAKALIDDKSFPTLVTLNPDGSPQASLMWVTRDGDEILLSTSRGTRKEKNLARDPRVGVLLPRENPQSGYVEVRGRAEVTEEGGRELIDSLYNKYIGEGTYPWDAPDAVRVVVRVQPEKVVALEQ